MVLTLDDKWAFEKAGFEEVGREGWVRGPMSRREVVGITGPHGRYYAYIHRKDRDTYAYLRGPRGGMRLFKSAEAIIKALNAKRLQEVGV
jgi:hypothetical protein